MTGSEKVKFPVKKPKKSVFVEITRKIIMLLQRFEMVFIQSQVSAYCLISVGKKYSTKGLRFTLAPRLLYIFYREF